MKEEIMGISSYLRRVIGNPVYCSVHTMAPNTALSTKVVAITGGGSGIGKAVAKNVIACGGKVIILGRREDKLKATVDELGNKQCGYYVYDVTNADGSVDLFEHLEKIHSIPVNTLVNNAGIYISKSPLEFTENDFNITLNTNLRAPIFLTIAFVKYCKSKHMEGNIVMTSSNRGLFGDYGPYGVSKKGLIHYVEGMARELVGTGIRINSVAPGMTASEINHISEQGDMYTGSAKGKRILLPIEIANVICFLLSDYSKCITGSTIPCDEGDSLR